MNLTYPIVVMVTIAHQNPSKAPRLNLRGNSSGLCDESCHKETLVSTKRFTEPCINYTCAFRFTQFFCSWKKMSFRSSCIQPFSVFFILICFLSYLAWLCHSKQSRLPETQLVVGILPICGLEMFHEHATWIHFAGSQNFKDWFYSSGE